MRKTRRSSVSTITGSSTAKQTSKCKHKGRARSPRSNRSTGANIINNSTSTSTSSKNSSGRQRSSSSSSRKQPIRQNRALRGQAWDLVLLLYEYGRNDVKLLILLNSSGRKQVSLGLHCSVFALHCSFGLFNYDSFVSFRAIGVIWGIRELTAELVCLLFWTLFVVPTLWGTLLCSLPCDGTDDQRHENHLYVDCPGVGQVARGLRTL